MFAGAVEVMDFDLGRKATIYVEQSYILASFSLFLSFSLSLFLSLSLSLNLSLSLKVIACAQKRRPSRYRELTLPPRHFTL